ncbi:MAG: hypothetical protein AAF304_09030 [Pseudomonadota bacterium]
MKKTILLVLALLVSGCTATSSKFPIVPFAVHLPPINYDPPSSGDTAQIRTSAEIDLIVFFNTYEKAESCENRKVIFNNEEGVSLFQRITANKDFAFKVWVSQRYLGEARRKKCQVVGVFEPIKDERYEIEVTRKENKCEITLFSLDSSTLRKVRVIEIEELKPRLPFSDSGKWCKKI